MMFERSDGSFYTGEGSKLVVEISTRTGATVTTITDVDENNNCNDATSTSIHSENRNKTLTDDDDDDCSTLLNGLSHNIINNTLIDEDGQSKIPIITTVKALHLHHSMNIPKGVDEMASAESDRGCDVDVGVCPLLGIPLPHSISERISNSRIGIDRNREDGLSDRQILMNILPQIHPSLTQLQPCFLFSFRGTSTCIKNIDMSIQQCKYPSDLLLLRIKINDPTMDRPTHSNEQVNGELVALYTIIDEINGEAMAGAASNVIESLLISQISFIVGDTDTDTDTCTQQFKSEERSSTINNESNVNEGTRTDAITGDMELPLCPVCRYRIEPERLGLPPLKSDQLCSHKHDRYCDNMKFLAPWDSATCEACRLLQKRLELSGAQPFYSDSRSEHEHEYRHEHGHRVQDKLQCFRCGMEETCWVCLTCGVVGCGRYSSGHAQQHFIESKHPFSLELATQRIWDYETSSFIQRDDLLNCPIMQQILGAVNRAAYHGAALCTESGQRGLEFGPVKKTVMIGEQYEVLLQSALEDQAQHFEGEISRLQAELAGETVNKGQLSNSEMKDIEDLERSIKEVRANVDNLSRCLVKAQAEEAGHRAKANSLLREQAAIQKISEDTRNDLRQEEKAGYNQIEELEQQISDITSNIRMREQISKNNDLNQAQIYGTSGEPKQQRSSKKKGSRRGRKK